MPDLTDQSFYGLALNQMIAPVLAELNGSISGQSSRRARIAVALVLAEGANECPAIAAHLRCVQSALLRLYTLLEYGEKYPDLFETAYQGLREKLMTTFPDVDFAALESFEVPPK